MGAICIVILHSHSCRRW